jgi:predicted DNA-binding transcriptional regulator AlpA
MESRRNSLPMNLPPRGLSRVEAAAYIGISPTLFDRMIKDGLMPRPVRVYARVLWDRICLDDAFAALPNGELQDEANDRDGYDERPIV